MIVDDSKDGYLTWLKTRLGLELTAKSEMMKQKLTDWEVFEADYDERIGIYNVEIKLVEADPTVKNFLSRRDTIERRIEATLHRHKDS